MLELAQALIEELGLATVWDEWGIDANIVVSDFKFQIESSFPMSRYSCSQMTSPKLTFGSSLHPTSFIN